MKTYNQINEKISSGKACLDGFRDEGIHQICGVRKRKDVDVVTTATFGDVIETLFGTASPRCA